MFNFFKKSQLSTEFVAPVDGQLIPITSVNDPVFSQKMIGDGFAVIPNNGTLVSPASGEISSVFPTKHALTITTETGLEVILHLGLDTVSLNGTPFSLTVVAGQHIQAGDLLGTMSLSDIQNSQLDPR
ncbi:PTS sugar transporter subunit IIA [Lacticaseibacillus daqingensis]|uniref:PTS sugar transporter subunit IIA n=1 Tax=Lacticaseibacillus daqingensis TaxID=2486014 RepID=UPI001CDC4509|nr:PTS glucose transporter subunit IIA [Lacticaseibacillus daqingensis]